MQRYLDTLMDWGSTWGMKFNAKKCNIMRVSRSRKPLQHFYSLGNEILQEVSDAKYLGTQICLTVIISNCRGLYFLVNQLLCIFIITIYETNYFIRN